MAAVSLIKQRPLTTTIPRSPFGIGCAQMIWIVVELAIIGELSFLHPTFFLVGLVIAVAAVPWGWPTFQAWRMTR